MTFGHLQTESVKSVVQLHAPVGRHPRPGISTSSATIFCQVSLVRPSSRRFFFFFFPAIFPLGGDGCWFSRRCVAAVGPGLPGVTGGNAAFNRAAAPAGRSVSPTLLLGPAADDRTSLPRDRLRVAANTRFSVLPPGPPPEPSRGRVGPMARLVLWKESPRAHRGAIGWVLRCGPWRSGRPCRRWDGATSGSRRGAGCSSWRGGAVSGSHSRSP